MQPQFSTTTLMSFHLWFDNYITQKGQAYTNTSSRLYYQPDSTLPQYAAYASPFRSWVCDSGVSGALIPSQISGSLGLGGTGFVNRGQSGMIIDFENGRVLFPAAVGPNAIISGSYAFKDLNVYKANETSETMVFTNKYYLNSRFARPITGIPPPREMVTPCVFISDASSTNDGFALGGAYNTTMHLTLNVLAENLTQLEGVNSMMTDAVDLCFPLLPFSAWPLGFLGDYKSGYNYQAYKQQYGGTSNLYSITEVRASKVGDGVKIDESIFLGIVDVTITKVRNIH